MFQRGSSFSTLARKGESAGLRILSRGDFDWSTYRLHPSEDKRTRLGCSRRIHLL